MSRPIFRTGFLPTPDQVKARFAASNFPELDVADWLAIDRRDYFHRLRWYPDQIDTNGCSGFSGAMCPSKARALAGQPPVKLSGAYLYSRINGGRDRGSNIGDALEVVMQHGVPPESMCDVHKNKNYIYRDNTVQFDDEAARFKGLHAMRCETVKQAAAGLQRGGILEFAVYVDPRQRFYRLDSQGVIDIVAGPGNHAVHADGMQKIGNEWFVDMQTWTEHYGDRSRGLVPLEYLARVKYQEMWIIFATIDDPSDDHDPPAPI